MRLFRTRYGKEYFESVLVHDAAGSQRNRNRLEEILPYHQRGRLLEIGCGTGGFLALASHHFEVECMDISTYAIARLSENLGVQARVANIEEATIPFERYHVVALYNVLEHLYDPGLTLAKIYYSLKPGGLVAGSFPNNFGLLGGIHTGLTNLFDRTHVSTYTPGRWYDLFQRAGFQSVNFFGEVLMGPNRSHNIHHPAWKWLSFNLMFTAVK